jgi:hypothetical protein
MATSISLWDTTTIRLVTLELQYLEHTKPSRLAHRAEPKHEWEAEPEGEDV